MPKNEVLATVDCPKCKARIEILQKREIIEPAIKAVVDVKYSTRLANQTKLEA